MTWTMESSRGFESRKIAHLAVPYTRGLGIDVGCGFEPVWPRCIGVDSTRHRHPHGGETVDVVAEAHRLPMFADVSLDYVFSSHLLEHVGDVRATLAEWTRIIKTGGYLALYLPSADLYPRIGQPGANPDHKRDIGRGDVAGWLKECTSCGWTVVEDEERSGADEYSFWQVFQKRADGHFVHQPWERNPNGRKRCLVIRYGAIGDQIMASSILPLLKREGYHVTYNTTPDAAEIVRANPAIDDWWLQDKDQVPNEQLGPYWKALEERFDRIVNLCESIEGSLLALPGRITHGYSHEARHRISGAVNYWERTHDIAGVPHVFDVRFYPTEEERHAARHMREKFAGPCVVWALNGSSHHKVYPFTNTVVGWLLRHTDAHVFLVGDASDGKTLQDAIIETLKRDGFDVSRVHARCGEWKIRECLAFVELADCVVGPETGVTNAAAMLAMPKVVMLSHSSHENLTKHWRNTTALGPPQNRCPCYPCHRMIYGWQDCHQVKATGAALCASEIKPERVFSAIRLGMKLELRTEAAAPAA